MAHVRKITQFYLPPTRLSTNGINHPDWGGFVTVTVLCGVDGDRPWCSVCRNTAVQRSGDGVFGLVGGTEGVCSLRVQTDGCQLARTNEFDVDDCKNSSVSTGIRSSTHRPCKYATPTHAHVLLGTLTFDFSSLRIILHCVAQKNRSVVSSCVQLIRQHWAKTHLCVYLLRPSSSGSLYLLLKPNSKTLV